MKKLIATIITTICLSNLAQAQLTLEHTYPYTTQANDLRFVKFGSIGEKYVVLEFDITTGSVNKVKVYNTNHSIYKQFNVPQITSLSAYNLLNFSDNLFNSNANIEYTAYYFDYSNGNPNAFSPFKMVVYDETGQTLLSADSVFLCHSDYNFGTNADNNYSIIKTTTGSKFIVYSNKSNNRSTYIYSIPGTPTVAGILSSDDLDTKKAYLGVPYPNPSSDVARIQFELPSDAELGEITVCNTEGFKLKSYMVDNTFNDLLLNNKDMPTGTYVYYLSVNGKKVGANKMMVIK